MMFLMTKLALTIGVESFGAAGARNLCQKRNFLVKR